MNWLKGKKTYLIAGLMVLVSMLHLITGDMSLAEFVTSDHVNTLLGGVGLGTLRAGVSKPPMRWKWSSPSSPATPPRARGYENYPFENQVSPRFRG